MRDHQLGTYGTIALILSLGLRATAIALIAKPDLVFAGLIAAEAAGRLASVLVRAGLPPARRDGLAASVGRPSFRLAAAAAGVALAIAWMTISFGPALLLILSALLGATLVGYIALNRFGGQTGDVLGAASQLCQCLALTVLAII
jgi:adenosylcobinamide-GDP ribazoletransferase